MGSMREARCAGIYPAISATAPNRAAMPANVAGSVGVVPKRSDAISLATANDATIPRAIPVSVSRRVLVSTPKSTRPELRFHRHASLEVFFNGEVEMSGHLSIKIAIQSLLSEKSAAGGSAPHEVNGSLVTTFSLESEHAAHDGREPLPVRNRYFSSFSFAPLSLAALIHARSTLPAMDGHSQITQISQIQAKHTVRGS